MTIIDTQPLPLHFSQDFLPERSLLARLLPVACNHGSGTKVQIGAATGIPTGESSGKVEPIILYARAMGLVRATKAGGSWSLAPTPLGRLVMAEDACLSEAVTQWLLHLIMCRRCSLQEPSVGIADPWYALFADGGMRLGTRFGEDAFLEYLTERYGAKGYLKSLSRLVLRCYHEQSCFGDLRVLAQVDDGGRPVYVRTSAPFERSYFPAYASFLYITWDMLFPADKQIDVAFLFAQSRWLNVMGWTRDEAAALLNWMADERLLQLDRQTGSTLALRVSEVTSVVAQTYTGLV